MKIFTRKYNQIRNFLKKVFCTKEMRQDDSKIYCPFCKIIKEKKEKGLKKILTYHRMDMLLAYVDHEFYKTLGVIDNCVYSLKNNIHIINIEESMAKSIMKRLTYILLPLYYIDWDQGDWSVLTHISLSLNYPFWVDLNIPYRR